MTCSTSPGQRLEGQEDGYGDIGSSSPTSFASLGFCRTHSSLKSPLWGSKAENRDSAPETQEGLGSGKGPRTSVGEEAAKLHPRAWLVGVHTGATAVGRLGSPSKS